MRIYIGLFLTLGMFLFPIIANLFIIPTRIYIKIKYSVNYSNREKIINKVENFDYENYLIGLEYQGYYYKNYVDKEFVEKLKNDVEQSKGHFYWNIFYSHYLKYSFSATFYKLLYATYNNESIYNVTTSDDSILAYIPDHSYGTSYYINYSIISYNGLNITKVELNNIYFIRIELKYGYYCGFLCALGLTIKQYIILNDNLDVILILIPTSGYWIS
ncbi:MAG: hypothetical protein ACP6IY_08845 [Promethearchaeia archaeon]